MTKRRNCHGEMIQLILFLSFQNILSLFFPTYIYISFNRVHLVLIGKTNSSSFNPVIMQFLCWVLFSCQIRQNFLCWAVSGLVDLEMITQILLILTKCHVIYIPEHVKIILCSISNFQYMCIMFSHLCFFKYSHLFFYKYMHRVGFNIYMISPKRLLWL